MKACEHQPDGRFLRFVVSDGAGRTMPQLATLARALFLQRLPGVLPLFEEASKRTGLPVNVLLGFAWQESLFNASAVSAVGATGIMQVMPFNWPKGASESDMKGAELGLRVGADILAKMGLSQGLPALASRYNGGSVKGGTPHPSTVSPWGYRENAGYIDGVISASNTAADVLPARSSSGGSIGPVLAAVALVALVLL